MSADIAIAWDNNLGVGDWAIAGGDLATATPLLSAVMVSLFTDARADDDYVLTDKSGDRRGWWGDTYNDFQIGSTLWQFDRAKKAGNTNLPLQIRHAVQDALQWLVDAGLVASLTVTTGWAAVGTIGIKIGLTEPDGRLTPFNFAWAWNGSDKATVTMVGG